MFGTVQIEEAAMASQNKELLLTISSETEDADEQELAGLSQQLRAALLESDADNIEPARGGSAPAGAKGDPITLASLIVMIAPRAVEGLFKIIQAWASRHERVTVTVKSGDKELTFTGEPSAEQRQFAADFLAHLKQ
jgi:hypothetical protein